MTPLTQHFSSPRNRNLPADARAARAAPARGVRCRRLSRWAAGARLRLGNRPAASARSRPIRRRSQPAATAVRSRGVRGDATARVPAPGRRDDVREVRVPRASSPAPRRARPVAATSSGGSPARRGASMHGHAASADLLDRPDHFAHRVALPGAEIEPHAVAAGRAAAAAPRTCASREVGHVDVVADRGAVRRRVVGAEDRRPGRAGPSAASIASGIRWVSGSWSSPTSPSASAPAALK